MLHLIWKFYFKCQTTWIRFVIDLTQSQLKFTHLIAKKNGKNKLIGQDTFMFDFIDICCSIETESVWNNVTTSHSAIAASLSPIW